MCPDQVNGRQGGLVGSTNTWILTAQNEGTANNDNTPVKKAHHNSIFE
jgi:hypothetical protein